MPGPSPFADDWRDCLRAHFQHVVHTQDTSTERTLIAVLHEVGFGDRELAELKVLATMRADETPGFTPDFDALTEQMLAQMQPQPEPQQSVYMAVAVEPAAQAEAAPEAEPAVVDIEPETAPEPPEDPPDYRAEGPQQMAFF